MTSIIEIKNGIASKLATAIEQESLINRKGSQASVKDQLGQRDRFVHAAICCAIADELGKSVTTAAMWGVASAVAWTPINDALKNVKGKAKMIRMAINELLKPDNVARGVGSKEQGRVGRFIDKRLHTRYDCWVAVDWLLLHDGKGNAYLICDGVASKTFADGADSRQIEEYGTVIIHAELNNDGRTATLHTTFLKFRGDESSFDFVDPEKVEESSWWWPF